MRITRSAEVAAAPMAAHHVTGSPISRDLGTYAEPDASVLLVSFPTGARSYWHRHPGGQFLYVTEGRGRVATRDGVVETIGVGDLVHAPPNEEHWHGAAADAAVTHLAVNLGATEWLEEVEP
jgi:quercetin dioxygenase-like cupin family protein